MAFYEITPAQLGENVFELFSKEAFLLTVAYAGSINTMTVGWGGLGVMWGKNVLITMVRPERHTYDLMEAADTFSMAVMGEANKKLVAHCGTVSGRDEDKIAACGLQVLHEGETPYFAESRVVFICRKLAAPALCREDFLGDDTIPDRWYREENGGYHTMFVGEILKILVKA